MTALKQKGDLAELRVAADLVRRGFQVAIPFGDASHVDLVVLHGRLCERVQVKYAESDGRRLLVRCRTQSLTSGRVRSTTRYSEATIDWLAVFDAGTDRCYYIPANELGSGRSELTLRLAPARNGQRSNVRDANDYLAGPSRPLEVEPAGLEPATSSLQKTRSTS